MPTTDYIRDPSLLICTYRTGCAPYQAFELLEERQPSTSYIYARESGDNNEFYGQFVREC